MASDADRQAARRISTTAAKLLAETIHLRSDVARLYDRASAFSGDVVTRELYAEMAKARKFVEALGMISRAREHIIQCESQMSAIRGHMEGNASGDISREEMKS